MKMYKTMLMPYCLSVLVVTIILAATTAVTQGKSGSVHHAPRLLAEYQAANYHPRARTWTNSSGGGHNAVLPAGVTAPALVPKATASGSPAVRFSGRKQYFKIIKGLPSRRGYTVVAFVEPKRVNVQTASAVVAGGPGSVEYRIQTMTNGQNKQVLLKTATMALGASNTAVPTDRFSTIAVSTNHTGNGTFYLNGNPDGKFTGQSAFSHRLMLIGAAATGPGATPAEFFSGDIAELRVYSGVLGPKQIKALAASFKKSFGKHQ